MALENLKLTSWDERRNILIPGDQTVTLDVCIRHFISSAQNALKTHGAFFVALAGGTTPKAVYQHLASPPYSDKIDWSKVHLFWGDERSVPPDNPDSNYKMAMDAGFSRLPIPTNHIHRMQAEGKIEENAKVYETLMRQVLRDHPLDLVILGMGEDGHTASLFPQTEALKVEGRLAVANYVPQKNTWRMTLTFEAINQAQNIVIYTLGASKKHTLKEVLTSPPQFDRYPIQKIGTAQNKALWIIDQAAASELVKE